MCWGNTSTTPSCHLSHWTIPQPFFLCSLLHSDLIGVWRSCMSSSSFCLLVQCFLACRTPSRCLWFEWALKLYLLFKNCAIRVVWQLASLHPKLGSRFVNWSGINPKACIICWTYMAWITNFFFFLIMPWEDLKTSKNWGWITMLCFERKCPQREWHC